MRLVAVQGRQARTYPAKHGGTWSRIKHERRAYTVDSILALQLYSQITLTAMLVAGVFVAFNF